MEIGKYRFGDGETETVREGGRQKQRGVERGKYKIGGGERRGTQQGGGEEEQTNRTKERKKAKNKKVKTKLWSILLCCRATLRKKSEDDSPAMSHSSSL